MAPPLVISASRLKTLAACERKYAGHYFFGLREEQGAAAKFGEQFHSAAEHYQLHGSLPPSCPPESAIGKLLRSGAHLLRKPGQGFIIEAEHRGELPDGTPWVAYLDASNTLPGSVAKQIHIDDQKTTSDRSRALTEITLPQDIQAGFYAWLVSVPHRYREGRDERLPWLEWDCRGLHSVALTWNYFLTRGAPQAWPVRAYFRPDAAERFLHERIMPLVQKAKALHAAHDRGELREINQAPHDIAGCDGMGTWCGAADRCDFHEPGLIQLRTKLDTHQKDKDTMGLAELREKYGQKNPAPAAPEPEPANTTPEEVAAPEPAPAAPAPKTRARRVAPPAEPPAPEGDRINPPEAKEALAQIRDEVAKVNAAIDAAPVEPADAAGATTTDDLVAALCSRGYTVTITRSSEVSQ